MEPEDECKGQASVKSASHLQLMKQSHIVLGIHRP